MPARGQRHRAGAALAIRELKRRMEMALKPIRRIVTGHDKKNVAKVIEDGPAKNTKVPREGVASTLMWCSDEMPTNIAIGEDVEDMGARILGTAPPENGSRFIVMEFAPGVSSEMHRTETIDYIAVLSGEMEMDMDNSTVKLKAGDIMIQRGTNHAWANRGTEPARMAIVLLDAKPLGIGHPRVRGEQAR
jgi:quercetin dioxygenase-like cupin family protein